MLSRSPPSTSRSSAEPQRSADLLATIVEEMTRMTKKHPLMGWKVALVTGTASDIRRVRQPSPPLGLAIEPSS